MNLPLRLASSAPIPLEKSQSALASCPLKKRDTDKVSQHVPQIYFKTGGISPLVVLRKYI